ncbi:MAG TPA: hypothetical protein DEQ47_14265 [Solibacterales bacterium]|nr:hypothetical protein [Bryobacterales bacterium]
MPNFFLIFCLATAAFGQQYKSAPAGAPPAELSPALSSRLQSAGLKVTGPAGAWCEIWFVKTAPNGPKSTEDAVTLPTIPVGSFLGVIRFAGNGADRRGQPLKPGLYTLRYVLTPVTGDHLGVAPQRDFAALVPVAVDKDPAAQPTLQQVIEMSTKASGTPHPAILSLASGSGTEGFTKEGEHDWTWNTKLGDLPVAIILAGKAEA